MGPKRPDRVPRRGQAAQIVIAWTRLISRLKPRFADPREVRAGDLNSVAVIGQILGWRLHGLNDRGTIEGVAAIGYEAWRIVSTV